jgi:hypothetical protein
MSRGARKFKRPIAPSMIGLITDRTEQDDIDTLIPPPPNPPSREWLWHRAQLAWPRIDEACLESVVALMESMAERGSHQ